MSQPEIALLMSTFERPEHLRRALHSVALQDIAADQLELVVTDDGSRDETPRIVADFARTAPFRVAFTTHEHSVFQLSRCRNEGVRASTAPYILFLDGDCILPRDHVRLHLAHRKPNTVMAGDCCRLEQDASERVTPQVIASGEFRQWGPAAELKRLKKIDRASRFYRLIRHPTKPKLIGNNVGIWRRDYERINGYDENFEGWGCEDDDLRHRLRQAGIGVASILRYTFTFHLWHPNVASMPTNWKEGANVQRLLRKGRLTRCRNGLEKRSLDDLSIRLVGEPAAAHPMAAWARRRFDKPHTEPEVEILLLPGSGRFSGKAECNVLVALNEAAAQSPAAREAHLTIRPDASGDLERALAAVA